MNKVVRKHYPASKLPAELREGIPDNVLVEISVVAEKRPVATIEELIDQTRKKGGSETSVEDGAKRIKALREEWEPNESKD